MTVKETSCEEKKTRNEKIFVGKSLDVGVFFWRVCVMLLFVDVVAAVLFFFCSFLCRWCYPQHPNGRSGCAYATHSLDVMLAALSSALSIHKLKLGKRKVIDVRVLLFLFVVYACVVCFTFFFLCC